MNTHFRMPAKSVLTLTAIAAVLTSINAQPDCNGERYRYTSTHDNVSVSEDHVYGNNVTALGVNTELVFDFYEAVDNAAADRPLIILAHGGFFLAGSNDGADALLFSDSSKSPRSALCVCMCVCGGGWE